MEQKEKKWKYLVEEIRSANADGIRQILTELGNHGWELVAVVGPKYYFKQPQTA